MTGNASHLTTLVVLSAPLALSVALWWAAPRVVRLCRPRLAATALTGAALVAAVSTGITLCAVAALALAEVPRLARLGGWSAHLLLVRAPVPAAAGAACGLVAAVLVGLSVRHATRVLHAVAVAVRAGRDLGPGVDGLVITADERPYAYAVPGLHGRTVVSRGLLRRLDATERRAVLAHEEAHRRHRHYAYVQLAELAAAANPLLRPAARAVRLAVESWADAVAAETIGDRRMTARTLARVALLGSAAMSGAAPGAALSIAESDLRARVAALLSEPPRRRARTVLAVLVAATLVGAASAGVVAVTAHGDFESAQAAYAHLGPRLSSVARTRHA